MIVLQAVATLIGQLLHLQDLAQRLATDGTGAAASRGRRGDAAGRVYQRVAAADRERIAQALAHAGGNKSRAAQMLGLTLRQFNYRYKVLGVG
ncbi:MAG: hypothetical protein E6R11_02455 [Rhodocyclaceae bacterium]|nr:MAG: hypothetical protein E6R11_02455 [Rhodocyclaceae bacterium]